MCIASLCDIGSYFNWLLEKSLKVIKIIGWHRDFSFFYFLRHSKSSIVTNIWIKELSCLLKLCKALINTRHSKNVIVKNINYTSQLYY